MECPGNSTTCLPWTHDSSGTWQGCEFPRLSDSQPQSQSEITWFPKHWRIHRPDQTRRMTRVPDPLGDYSEHLLVLRQPVSDLFWRNRLYSLTSDTHMHSPRRDWCCDPTDTMDTDTNSSRVRRHIVSHMNLKNWTWCSGNSWRLRNWLDLHCRFGLNCTCLWVSIHTSLSLTPTSPVSRLWLKKLKRHTSRTASLILINTHFTIEMKWNVGPPP